jgi:hypothetical protein
MKNKKVTFWIRLTFPLAMIIFTLMYLILPLVFLFTGKWKYSISEDNVITKWFLGLGLIEKE